MYTLMIIDITVYCDRPFLPAWTSFYMAGELILGLRKAQENKWVSVPATKNDMGKAA